MDGSPHEHSDSDSGESWTLLENTPSYAEEAPNFERSPSQAGDTLHNVDKDEDTDGISIISDSDPESPTPGDLGYDHCLLDETCPTVNIPEFVSVNTLPNNNAHKHESIRADDILGDNNGKLKTYVHRRNKRLSTVLNIIVLGSVITAVGVAIGHMWGAKNDCFTQNTPSVNKILSNLYKLQEENSFLRSKIKELTMVNSLHVQQKRTEADKVPYRNKHRCKKVFEESLTNNNKGNKFTKCVDIDNGPDKLLQEHLIQPDYEKDFIDDINKLKSVYQQNKSWLDDEVARRMKYEKQSLQILENTLKSPKSISVNEERKSSADDNAKKQLEATSEIPAETVINVTEPIPLPIIIIEDYDAKEDTPVPKVTYADSLKSGHKIKKREIDSSKYESKKERTKKRKIRKEYDTLSENSASEVDMKKDDRYNFHKFKPERKKNDRHKIYKKQKRRNKYEQWEMKGGYMKDYDDFSVTSSQENEFVLKNPDKNKLSRDFERKNYINQFSDTEDSTKGDDKQTNTSLKRERGKKEDMKNWYEKRAALRNEARKKLEQELFGESSPNNANWYFRRMQRREQCRVKADNSTHKKLSKRIMNFKTKH